MYERGAPGVEKDQEQALRWYRRAVFEGDDPIAHLGLGRAYGNGKATAVNYELAFQHYSAAHRHGLPASGIYLGFMHYRGHGMPRDLSKAEHYFKIAADAGYPAAFVYLAKIALA
jgi:TPR repeat protein